MLYCPKGEMCLSCIHLMEDCSHLNFSEMRVIEQDEDCYIVKCIGFEREEK